MRINLKNAVKIFFPNPSLEMVYFEAVANAMDANASLIEIFINIDSLSKTETYTIEIVDNGDGFTDKNFEKFSKLLEIEEKGHKGVGRLVFLNYFEEVYVNSIYQDQKRVFTLSNTFDGDNILSKGHGILKRTSLLFKNYVKNKINSYDYVKPEAIKKALMEHFYPQLYQYKVNAKELRISIELKTNNPNPQYNFYPDVKEINVSQIPDLKLTSFKSEEIDLYENLDLYYSVEQREGAISTTITALSVDGRTIPVDVISKGGIPQGYEIIFLLYSNLFAGKVNISRQELDMDDAELKVIKRIFGEKIIEILDIKIPSIKTINEVTTKSLENRYPHLNGLFESNSVGLVDRNQSLEIAQRRFFQEQKEVLDAVSLTDEVYEKSLQLSARILTEYILYRNIVIEKLKKVDKENNEDEIHNLIVPKRSTLSKSNFHNDLFTNNAWLLDDKYMSYKTILSERHMSEVLSHLVISDEDSVDQELEKSNKRPDITIIFSNNPDQVEKVDVVIVELKKLGLGLAKREEVTSQLRQRARKLLQYFPDKIQRIWFYGIVDIDDEFKVSLLEDKYVELFSCGTVFYKEQSIITDLDKRTEIPVGLYVLSFEAFLRDAEVRNSTFLNLLKEELKGSDKSA
ncbi:ATP-binding protein [Dyadobacter flavalbus]|uniref:ATP-binding protein n=1 Tax=Dyadobacter flavalbus TaxID=2579942 RepID=A0A5M8QZU9_9BACT|nr:ATP-binding protein [Dyadobacter flavalbus]KAA6439542.1 ATP-binding protein [Dyadobacter flavalbus]